MNKEEKINQINNELKVYINESSFISMKCRNQLLHIFEEEFQIELDIENYKNVDLSIQDDYQILYREDLYASNEPITNLDDLVERYKNFKARADVLIRRKNVDFQGRRNLNNFFNLVIVICGFLILLIAFLLGLFAFLNGRYFDCLWFLVVIVPILIPRWKDYFGERIVQAKSYLKSLWKKVK